MDRKKKAVHVKEAELFKLLVTKKWASEQCSWAAQYAERTSQQWTPSHVGLCHALVKFPAWHALHALAQYSSSAMFPTLPFTSLYSVLLPECLSQTYYDSWSIRQFLNDSWSSLQNWWLGSATTVKTRPTTRAWVARTRMILHLSISKNSPG